MTNAQLTPRPALALQRQGQRMSHLHEVGGWEVLDSERLCTRRWYCGRLAIASVFPGDRGLAGIGQQVSLATRFLRRKSQDVLDARGHVCCA
jgi:hypothetical protein